MGRRSVRSRQAHAQRKYSGANGFGRYYQEGEQRVLDEGEIENFEVKVLDILQEEMMGNESKEDLSTNGV